MPVADWICNITKNVVMIWAYHDEGMMYRSAVQAVVVR